MDAVVLDLFGTVVAAPTPAERARAASRLASVVGCDAGTVERYFRSTWHIRHDGSLPTLTDLAAHLVHTVNGPHVVVGLVADELLSLGKARLAPAASIVDALESLRSSGARVGILSDASAEIAAAWPSSQLAALVDAVVFSCEAKHIKPTRWLYQRVLNKLDVSAHRALYVGDGGGDELRGALTAGMAVVAVTRRGPAESIAFGKTSWSGTVLKAVEVLPAYLRSCT